MRNFFKKCLLTLGLCLFFSVIFSYPSVDNIMVAKASNVKNAQNEQQNDVMLNVKSKSIVKDTTFNLVLYNIKDNYKVNYKSSKNSIATVDDTGMITGVDFGTATITVTVKDGFKTIATLECEITVGPPAINVVLTKSEITLTVGSKTTLTAILQSKNTVEEALFFSNDTEIASVTPGGTVTANKVGTTFVFATIANGKQDKCKITVVKDEAKDTTKNNAKEETTNVTQ